jgi:hypothetical protein
VIRSSCAAFVLVLVLAGCAAEPTDAGRSVSSTIRANTTTNPTTPPPTTTSSVAPSTSPATSVPEPSPVLISLRIADRSTPPDAALVEVVSATLTDPRGWTGAGFTFRFDANGPYELILAEPAEADRLCQPYQVSSTYSCQLGPRVILNADRWRSATPTWPGDLDSYRAMLINHEVGHLLGQHHPRSSCQDAGSPAPVMFQQSKGLVACVANPWPLPWELACAALHIEELAPPYEPDARPACGPDDVSPAAPDPPARSAEPPTPG